MILCSVVSSLKFCSRPIHSPLMMRQECNFPSLVISFPAVTSSAGLDEKLNCLFVCKSLAFFLSVSLLLIWVASLDWPLLCLPRFFLWDLMSRLIYDTRLLPLDLEYFPLMSQTRDPNFSTSGQYFITLLSRPSGTGSSYFWSFILQSSLHIQLPFYLITKSMLNLQSESKKQTLVSC